MDYIGNKCPVCNKYFHADDDIVVCPDCGTPHHRECYEQLGHCCNSELHEQGYDYENDSTNDGVKTNICPSCGCENEPDAFFCKKCGASLGGGSTQNTTNQGANRSPFGAGAGSFNMPVIDPLGGIPGDSDLGDDITAGEAAKYVKQNTPYFMRVFSNIKNFDKSKFNFSAALFRGGYLLYRKMYLPGAIVTAIQLIMTFVSTYIQIFGYKYMSEEFTKLYNQAMTTFTLADISNAVSHASPTDFFYAFTPFIIIIINFVLMIVLGVCFNKMYFKHCKKQINQIKKTSEENGENPETALQTKGGVNMGLAMSLLISYILLTYLPNIIIGFM